MPTTPPIPPAVARRSPANRRAFDDPRSHFIVDDAKSYFSAGRRRLW